MVKTIKNEEIKKLVLTLISQIIVISPQNIIKNSLGKIFATIIKKPAN